MANFVPGDASPIAQITPWSPDWSFLEQVYGVTQMRYDKGFNMVKNLYNSVLNNPLTNDQNQAFRNEMFQKIQGSLKNVSALDLANPTNVMRAQKLLDPITDDKELAYDMYVTKYHNGQKELMNSYKNSMDSKVRDKYSDYSKMDIQFAEDDLKKAKRGDGSITSVQPRDFTPFENINEYLNEQGKKAKLQVKLAKPDGKGYIHIYTNGKAAEEPFSVWAGTMLGAEKFKRQFDVIGRVTAESQVRDLVAQGMSRADATTKIAGDLAKSYTESQKIESTELSNNLNDLELEINTIKKSYPNGVPSSRTDIADRYNKLLEARYKIYKAKSEADTEVKNIESDAVNYTSNNLSRIYSNQARKQAAIAWGVGTADATSDVDIKPDQKVIADMNRAASNANAAADRAQRWQMHKDKMELGKQKMAKAEEIAKMKLKAEGKLPDESYIGTYLGTAITGVKALSEAGSKNRDDLFNAAFGGQNGLINLIVKEGKDASKYHQVLSKVSQMSGNPNIELNDNELGILKAYANLVNYRTALPDLKKDRTAADQLLYNLAGFTYKQSTKALEAYTGAGKTKEGMKYAEAFSSSIAAMKGVTQELTNISKGYRNIANRIYNYNSGTVKAGYEAAKVISRLDDGTPIFDLSGLSEAQQQSLSQTIPAEFDTKTRPVGSIYDMTLPTPAEIFAMFNTANTATITTTGEKINPEVMKDIARKSVSDIFGDAFTASFDPGAEKVIIDLLLSPTSKTAKELKIKAGEGEKVRVEIPYAQIKSNSALKRFQAGIKLNSVNYDSFGIMEEFSRNKSARVEGPSYMEKTGFDFVATGMKNNYGQYGVNLDFKMINPQTKVVENLSKFVKLDPSNLSNYSDVSDVINNQWTNYLNASGAWNTQFDSETLVSLKDDLTDEEKDLLDADADANSEDEGE
jgi:hypothetical protein